MSGEKVPYHLRQNKYVDRQLFVDVLAHINRVRDITAYLYISFGGPYLEDFKVIHSNFGNQKMLSLESEEWVYERQQFNVPYGCIDCENLKSDEFLEQFDDFIIRYSAANILVWLDYARADKLRMQLNEFAALIQHARSFDIIKLTINANPASMGERIVKIPPETAEELRTRQLEKLKLKLGDYLPAGVTTDDMEQSRYATVLLSSIRIAAHEGIKGSPNLILQPLTAFVYQDSLHQMLTATCIILEQGKSEAFLKNSGLGKYEFRSLDWKEPIKINVPYLSVKEKFYLDNMLFRNTRKSDRSRLKSGAALKVKLAKNEDDATQMLRQYFLFYRYYPHYHRIQY